MIVYNISIKIFPEIEKEWVQWQKEEHIPDVMASGQFTDYTFYKLLEQDDDGITFIVQYFAPSLDNYHYYINNIAPSLKQKSFDKWGDKFIAFRSVMQTVD